MTVNINEEEAEEVPEFALSEKNPLMKVVNAESVSADAAPPCTPRDSCSQPKSPCSPRVSVGILPHRYPHMRLAEL